MQLFNETPVTIPEHKLDYYKQKIKSLLTYIGGECYINKLREKPSPFKTPITSKKKQETTHKGLIRDRKSLV